jgi:hypothetical protein
LFHNFLPAIWVTVLSFGCQRAVRVSEAKVRRQQRTVCLGRFATAAQEPRVFIRFFNLRFIGIGFDEKFLKPFVDGKFFAGKFSADKFKLRFVSM